MHAHMYASTYMLTRPMWQYFGYCKKEVKTQLAYTANLYGQTEEEHAGGCLAYPSYDLGEEFHAKDLDKIPTKVSLSVYV